MKNYVIITDTSCDLPKELRERYSIEYIPMHYSYNDKDYTASLDWEELSAPDFYNVIRGGTRIITAQITALEYKSEFSKWLDKGYDILSLSCSSALSASVKASYIARDELLQSHPDSKIICIDTLSGCASVGLLCIKASMLREQGKSLEENAAWIEENKLKINMEGTVDKLIYLKQAGRVSAASAFFGGLLNIKPIIISDAKGQNAAVEKIKGRKNSFARLVERFEDRYIPSDLPIFISQADCMEDAEELKSMILEKLDNKDTEIHIVYVGPAVGASVGPGMIGLFYYGKEVTYGA